MKYLISSHANYYQKTLPKILASLNSENVIVTIGGVKQISEDYGVQVDCVEYNSFEYVSLINFVEKGYKSDFVFLLHDTMSCGDKFIELSKNFNPEFNATMAHPKGFCNLGVFKVEYLQEIKPKLLKMKDMSKREAIRLEGKFFRPNFTTYPNAVSEKIEIKDVYDTGTLRSVDHYKAVNIYKYGANSRKTLRAGKIILDL